MLLMKDFVTSFCSALTGYGIGMLCSELSLSVRVVSLTSDFEPRRLLLAEFPSYDPIGGVEKLDYEVVDDKVTSDHMPIVAELVIGFDDSGATEFFK